MKITELKDEEYEILMMRRLVNQGSKLFPISRIVVEDKLFGHPSSSISFIVYSESFADSRQWIELSCFYPDEFFYLMSLGVEFDPKWQLKLQDIIQGSTKTNEKFLNPKPLNWEYFSFNQKVLWVVANGQPFQYKTAWDVSHKIEDIEKGNTWGKKVSKALRDLGIKKIAGFYGIGQELPEATIELLNTLNLNRQ